MLSMDLKIIIKGIGGYLQNINAKVVNTQPTYLLLHVFNLENKFTMEWSH